MWTFLGVDNKAAKVLSTDKMGLEFELTNAAGNTRVERYEFASDGKKAAVDVAAVREKVYYLQVKARLAVLPNNVGTVISLLLWVLLICGSPELDFIKHKFVKVLRSISLSIFQNATNTKIALYILIASHVCEAIYACTLMSQMKLDTFSKLSWSLLIIVIGFPVTSQVMFLHKYWQESNSDESEKKKNE